MAATTWDGLPISPDAPHGVSLEIALARCLPEVVGAGVRYVAEQLQAR